jgi:hypothetical protein
LKKNVAMKSIIQNSDDELFLEFILPIIKEKYPLFKINSFKRTKDGFRVHFLRMRTHPGSEVNMTYLILKSEVIQLSEN